MTKKPSELEKRIEDIKKHLSEMAMTARENHAGLIAIGITTAVFIAKQPQVVEDTRILLTELVTKTREGPGPWDAVIVIPVEMADFIVGQLKLDTTETGKKL